MFSTVINLASLQIQNSLFELKQLDLRSLRCDLNRYRKNLDSLLRIIFLNSMRFVVVLQSSLYFNPGILVSLWLKDCVPVKQKRANTLFPWDMAL